ncbi:acyl--CoA ligase [Lentzea alba]|uniref:class I adenylate-forming enzyme family protein n=1 Tax=Lentzea alba TaxID=2714351 RepID=UPI0039BF0466
MNLVKYLDRWANRTPLAIALRYADDELTYAELDLRVSGVATDLTEAGVGRGDRVAVLAGSNVKFVAAVYGIWKLGAIVVLINPHLSASDVARQTRHAGAAIVVVDDDPDRWSSASAIGDVQVLHTGNRRGPAVPAVDVDPESIAVIAYTSGSTGVAKGVAHTHEAMRTQVEVVGEHYAVTSKDRVLSLLPPFHLSIFVGGPLLALSAGVAARVITPYRAIDVVRAIEQDGTTITTAVPSFFHDLHARSGMGANFDLSSLRVVASGGAPLPDQLRDDLEQRHGFRILQFYGMTEGPAILTCDPLTGSRREGSVGRALPHISLSIVNEHHDEVPAGAVGEVCVGPKGEGVHAGRYKTMAQYCGMPEETEEALRGGLLHTGDIGYLDEEGFLYLLDRKKDVIIRGGMNIYPREIELVLSGDSRIAECVVVGSPHARYGEVPVAYVRLRPGTVAQTEELVRITNSRLSSLQQLAAVHLVENFPRNSLGMVLKRDLARD